MKKITILSMSLLALFSCDTKDHYGTPDLSGQCTTMTPNVTVASVMSSATTTATDYVDSTPDDKDYIEAYVTSSDAGGNFYKSISCVSADNTLGFSIPVDDYNLYTKFEPGRKIYVNLNGRTIGINTKTYSLEIGDNYAGNVGRISKLTYQDVLKRSCDAVEEETLVNHVSITAAKSDAYLNKLVEFDAVQFTDASMGNHYFESSMNASPTWTATNHYITDVDGNSIILRASQYATFANDLIPSGNGKIRGVMTRYNSDYQFMIRTLDDVQLTGSRYVPILNEGFDAGMGNWAQYSVTGAQLWTYSATYGNPGGMMKMSGYTTTNNANEDWLISPSLNLSALSSATLSFDNAYKYAGNAIQVYISNNYTSGAPSTATWTELTGFTLSSGNYVYANSGDLNINSFTGTGNSNVRIAFKYTCTTSAASTWEIDNVKVEGN